MRGDTRVISGTMGLFLLSGNEKISAKPRPLLWAIQSLCEFTQHFCCMIDGHLTQERKIHRNKNVFPPSLNMLVSIETAGVVAYIPLKGVLATVFTPQTSPTTA